MHQFARFLHHCVVCFSLFGAASTALADATPTSRDATPPVVVVFGDSLSAAYGLAQESGWVSLLSERLARHSPPYRVVNASISGETTRGGLSRIAQTLNEYHPAIVIIELGGNDGLRGLSLSATRDNLDALVRAAKAAKAKVLLVGVELPPNYGAVYTEGFGDNFAQVAKEQSVPLVASLLRGFEAQRDLFQGDGVHPVAKAQPLMLETVWKELEPLLRIR
jgi:acyl-CoA thioesterase-1